MAGGAYDRRYEVLGVIAVQSYTTENVYDEGHLNLLPTIAAQAAVAIENTELIVKSKVIREELESRKRVERAKGILMKEHGLGEEKAYQRIQRYAMDSRKTMREVAEAIVLTFEMKRGHGLRDLPRQRRGEGA